MKNQRNRARHLVGPILALVGLMGTLVPALTRLAAAQGVAASWSHTGNLNFARAVHTATLLPNGKVLVVGGRDFNSGGGIVNRAELYDSSSGTWSSAGLSTGRFAHTATLLLNGRVLVVGGYDGSHPLNILNSAELYDPATGTWSITGNLNTPRAGYHAATLLPNGKVLVVGGIVDPDGHSTNSAEIYDPANGTWSYTGNLNTEPGGPAMLLPNGKVLVVGSDRMDLYDPATGTWSITVNPDPIAYHSTATLLPDGKILLAGGMEIDCFGGCPSNSAELYDPATGTWTSTGNLNLAGGGHTAILLVSGKVLVIGYGNSAELYDPPTGTWSITANLDTARVAYTATLLSNGKVLVAGGNVSGGLGTLNTAELYDPGTNPTATPTPTPTATPTAAPTATPTPTPTSTPVVGPSWTYTGNLNTGRSGHTATPLQNGKVLVAGGDNNRAELYDPATGTWSYTGNLSAARGYHAATLLPNGKVLVAGGYNVSGDLSSAELYEPTTGMWSSTGNLSTARECHTATPLQNGKVLVAGGSGSSGAGLESAELYDPATGTWSNTGILNTGRSGHTATLLRNGKVLVAGGYSNNDDDVLYRAELYDPNTGVWTNTGGLNTGRGGSHTATLLPSGKVLVAGGFDGFTSFLNGAELYDPATGTWSNTGILNPGRGFHSATLLPNGKVLVAGGYNDFHLSSAELYDPATGTWSITANLNSAHASHTATLLSNGKVLVAGGSNDNTAELYDPGTNAIDDARVFVRQHYLDFLNREPDQSGWDYWTNRITECGSDARCIHERRLGVSAAFFIELEFQDTGYYVYRFYKASFGRQPTFAEFTSDRSRVVSGSNLEANKQAFADEWVQRAAFLAAYPITMSNTEVVNKLFDSAGLTSSIYDPQRQQEIAAMNAGRSRALVLRDVIEIPDFKNIPDPNDPRYSEIKQISQYNPAFVLMQYFGYLHRDIDPGYDFWLDIVNNREPNNYHGMVCSFITSSEYQLRFGSVVTRSNADCSR